MKKESKLKRMVKKSGLKLKEIAARRGVSPCVVTRQVSKGVKTLKIAREYAEVLGCDPVEVLD